MCVTLPDIELEASAFAWLCPSQLCTRMFTLAALSMSQITAKGLELKLSVVLNKYIMTTLIREIAVSYSVVQRSNFCHKL